MNADELPIPEPCCESWDEMTGDEVKRHCDACDKDVVNLSQMTEYEAREFLRTTPSPCIRFVSQDSGNVVFLHPQLRRQRRGLRQLLGSATLLVPLLFAAPGCQAEIDDSMDHEATSVEPLQEGEEAIVNASGMAHLDIEDDVISKEDDEDAYADGGEEFDGDEDAHADGDEEVDGDEVEPIDPLQEEPMVMGEFLPKEKW